VLTLLRCRGIALGALLFANACTEHVAGPMGPSPISDPDVRVFHADMSTTWPQFRLGDGLNVVVVDPNLPRTIQWRFNAGHVAGGISSSPVVYRGIVLVAANDRNLYAIDAASGKLQWRYLSTDALMTQPLYAHGLAIVASGNSECIVCFYPTYVVVGSGFNRISAVNLTSGKERWGRRIDGNGMPTGALVGTSVVHPDGSGAVLSFDMLSGRSQWAARLPADFSMSSALDGHDGKIYVSGSFPAAVYALSASSGALRWRHVFGLNVEGSGDAPMASTKDAVFGEYLQALAPHSFWGWMVSAGSSVRQHIFSLDKETGNVLWDRAVTTGVAPKNNEASIPLIYRGALFEGSPIGPRLTALDARTGRILWQLQTRGPVKGGIVALNGILYFGDLGGYLWAVDAKTGRKMGRLRTEVHFNVGSPIILNDSLVDGSQEGAVIALPLRRILDARD
jgi:eukaryotic-like serine/threonine-protein kinase